VLPRIDQSNAWIERAHGLIPALSQTLAKGPTQYVRGVAPKYLARGKGAHVWDVDGNEFIDLTMAVGPLSLGYCYGPVDEAIRAQLAQGITFSLMHPLEVEVSELVRDIVPNAESVRFSKTGADVTSAAVRLARAHTGRDRVLCSGYHGWHDWYAGLLPRNGGVPGAVRELVRSFPYNDLERALELMDERVACVILEPVLFEEPRAGFLEGLRRACTDRGALLVFDEMWTGFRVALGGAQERYGVNADLACFSKAVANGMPLSILAGRRDVMRHLDEDVFFFTTFGGEALSLAAARATLSEMRDRDVVGHIAKQGRRLKHGYNHIAEELGLSFTRAVGLDCRSMVVFDGKEPLLAKSLVQQELVRHGVLWSGFHNVSFSHTDADVDHVLGAYRAALGVLRDAVAEGDLAARLRGEPIEPTMRPTR
jgi:glutamate-1-semialdehyde aminotransferase